MKLRLASAIKFRNGLVPPEVPVSRVCKRRAKAFEVSFRPPAIALEAASHLAETGSERSSHEDGWVDRTLEHELKLLFRIERQRILTVDHIEVGSTPRILLRSSSFNCSPAVWSSGLACCGVADPALLLSCEPPVGGGLDDCGASGRVELSDAARTDTGEASSKTSGCNDGLWAHTRGHRQTSPNSKRYMEKAVMEKK
jgi:hypothetical protein